MSWNFHMFQTSEYPVKLGNSANPNVVVGFAGKEWENVEDNIGSQSTASKEEQNVVDDLQKRTKLYILQRLLYQSLRLVNDFNIKRLN